MAAVQLAAGDRVAVSEEFKVKNNIDLKVGLTGCVVRVDNDGDALISFEFGATTTKHWVFARHFHRLQVVAEAEQHGQKRKLDADKFVEGSQVAVVDAFTSNHQKQNRKELSVGLTGSVVKIDNDGDALIAFAFKEGIMKQWVFKRNFHKLQLQAELSNASTPASEAAQPAPAPAAKRQRSGSWFPCARRAAISGA